MTRTNANSMLMMMMTTTWWWGLLLLLLLLGNGILLDAVEVTFINHCTTPVLLYNNTWTERIKVGDLVHRPLPAGTSGMFRHGAPHTATLFEWAVDKDLTAWYDISLIPPGIRTKDGYCSSYDDCKNKTNNSTGFNVAMQVVPTIRTCKVLRCLADKCPDAYLFPIDDSKNHMCPGNTNFNVTFCPKEEDFVTDLSSGVDDTSTIAKPVSQNTSNPSSSKDATVIEPSAKPKSDGTKNTDETVSTGIPVGFWVVMAVGAVIIVGGAVKLFVAVPSTTSSLHCNKTHVQQQQQQQPAGLGAAGQRNDSIMVLTPSNDNVNATIHQALQSP